MLNQEKSGKQLARTCWNTDFFASCNFHADVALTTQANSDTAFLPQCHAGGMYVSARVGQTDLTHVQILYSWNVDMKQNSYYV